MLHGKLSNSFRTYRLLTIILGPIVIFYGYLCLPSWAVEPTWVSVDGVAEIRDGGSASARQRAIRIAEQKALSQAAGVEITAEYLWINFSHNESLAGVIPFSKIVEKQILSESAVAASASAPSTYSVQIRAAVTVEKTGYDPHFYVNASLEKISCIDGQFAHEKDKQCAQITISVSQDCYVWIFDISDGVEVGRLFPDSIKEMAYLKAENEFIFPGKIADKLMIYNINENMHTNESIYILALKQDFSDLLNTIRVDSNSKGSSHQQTRNVLDDLVTLVMSIPLDQRAETLIPYHQD